MLICTCSLESFDVAGIFKGRVEDQVVWVYGEAAFDVSIDAHIV